MIASANGVYPKKPKKAKSPEPDYGRLVSAALTSQKVMEVYRVNRREMVREFVGSRWSEEGARKPVNLNLLSLFVQIVGRNLISKNPRVMLSTFERDKKPDVDKMQQWANDRIEQMDLAESLRRVVTDALFSIGVMKVALATPDDALTSGWNVPAGTPFAESIDLDDFLYDSYAKDFKTADFVGHRYRIEKTAAHERFGEKSCTGMALETNPKFNPTGDERIGVMGRGQYADQEFEEKYTVWEFYLPKYRLVCTLAGDSLGSPALSGGGDVEPLEVKEWLGPDCGPYHYLGFGVVPGNAMPKGPIMDLFDMHDAVNRTLRKLIRQADRQKEVYAVGAAASEDGQRVITANDGDMIQCNSPESIKPMVTGGPNPQNFALMLQLKELFSWAAGNLDLMGGLSPQSKTAAQDKMLNENSARSVADMQESTLTFTASVLKSLCWYWWNHPQLRMDSVYNPPNVPEVTVKRTLTPLDRKRTKYSDMQVKVDPYSLLHSTPASKAAAVNQIVQQTIAPMMQLLERQGVQFDAGAYVELLSKYLDLPELQDILTTAAPPTPDQGQPAGGGSSAPGMPAQTNRTYTRENVSGTTSKGQDMAMANAMSGTDSGGDPNA